MTNVTYTEDPIFLAALADARAQPARASAVRRWSRRLVNGAVALIVVASLLVAYGLVDNRWYRIVAVQGASMSPSLSTGDAIVITRPPAELEPGMVVTLEVDGQIVTHRIVAVDGEGGFTTRGDANAVDDDWRGLDVEVVGVQRARIPWLGGLLSGLSGVIGSNAWQSDRATVGGSSSADPCFAVCGPEATPSGEEQGGG